MKKIFFLTVIFLVFIFAPLFCAKAVSMYVGVQIASAQAPGCTPGTITCNESATGKDSRWCLPVGTSASNSSQMAITKSDSCTRADSPTYNDTATYICSSCSAGYCLPSLSSKTNPFSIDYPVCMGDTLWSGLLDVTNGQNYKAYLYVPNFCPGYLNGNCYVASSADENCCDVCSDYGLTVVSGYSNCESSTSCYNARSYDDATCKVASKVRGSNCASCTTGAAYDFFDGSGNCWTTFGTGTSYVSCSNVVTGYKRVCSCNYPTTATKFQFPFTANF
jgi:hypothetical protein